MHYLLLLLLTNHHLHSSLAIHALVFQAPLLVDQVFLPQLVPKMQPLDQLSTNSSRTLHAKKTSMQQNSDQDLITAMQAHAKSTRNYTHSKEPSTTRETFNSRNSERFSQPHLECHAPRSMPLQVSPVVL